MRRVQLRWVVPDIWNSLVYVHHCTSFAPIWFPLQQFQTNVLRANKQFRYGQTDDGRTNTPSFRVSCSQPKRKRHLKRLWSTPLEHTQHSVRMTVQPKMRKRHNSSFDCHHAITRWYKRYIQLTHSLRMFFPLKRPHRIHHLCQPVSTGLVFIFFKVFGWQ